MCDLPIVLEVQIPDRLVIKKRIIPVDMPPTRQPQQEVSPSRAIGSEGAAASRTRRQAKARRLITVAVEWVELCPLPGESKLSIRIVRHRAVDRISVGVIENP